MRGDDNAHSRRSLAFALRPHRIEINYFLFALFAIVQSNTSACEPNSATILGSLLATVEPSRQTAPMSEPSNLTSTSFFAASTNEHTVFAGTLRNWCDPLLQGQAQIAVPVCPRCAGCKCRSVNETPHSPSTSDSPRQRYHQNHHHHDPSCPNYRLHERSKTTSASRMARQPKRRANSYDSSVASDPYTLSIDSRTEHSSSPSTTRGMPPSRSKIPVRIRSTSSSMVTTPVSEYSSASSINETRSSERRTRLPRPISQTRSSLPATYVNAKPTKSTSDDQSEDYDLDRSVHSHSCARREEKFIS